jgi:hypothetical protein
MAEKTKDAMAELAFCDEEGMEYPDVALSGFFKEFEDFCEWLPEIHSAYAERIFAELQLLIGY